MKAKTPINGTVFCKKKKLINNFMLEGPNVNKQEEQEGIPQRDKAVAAITCGVLWGALKAAGKYDVSIPTGLFGSIGGIKPTEKEEETIEQEGWIGTMIEKSKRAYKHIENIENLLSGKV